MTYTSVHKPNSSTIETIWYNQDDRKLIVEFKGGTDRNQRTYLYENVPAEIYSNLLAAPSAGKFMAQNVKGKFTFSKFTIDFTPDKLT